MTTPKSANERIRRKVRKKKASPKDKSMTGRIVKKKSANNDPNKNHSDAVNKRRHMAAEEFLKLYRGEDVENPDRFYNLVENLIEVCIEAGGKVKYPFKISRLCELRESLTKDATPYVIVKQVMEPREVHVCPVCKEEIGEKSTYLPEDQRSPSITNPEWQHNVCGGRFRYPPSDISFDDLFKSHPIEVSADVSD